MRYLLWFFVVVPPVPPLMVRAFAAIAILAAVVLIVDPAGGAAAVTPIVVLQLFASSSGFAIPARRGHLDLLLTRGEGRVRLALAHWLASIGPGAASWLAVGLFEAAISGGSRMAAFASGTCAALAVSCTLPWAIGIALPRFAPGIGWLLVVVTVASIVPANVTAAWLRAPAAEPASVTAAAVFLLYPISAVGRSLAPREALMVAPALIASTVAMAVACRWIRRATFPLEAAQ